MIHRNNGVNFFKISHLIKTATSCGTEVEIDGIKCWVPARPLGWTEWPKRLKAVWLVWTGRADVVTWPGQ